MSKVIPLVVWIALVTAVGCHTAPKVNIAVEQERLRTVMERINTAWETEDVEAFSRLVTHDEEMVNFGTDVNDRWVGWEGLKRGLLQQFEVFSETKVTPQHIDVNVSDSGDVAWIAQAMNIKTKFLGNSVDLEARITGVFVKKDADWLLVHFHYSVPISESKGLGI